MTAQDQLDIRNRHRLSVEEYLLLDREGAFGDRRTELYDGEVYYMIPKHRPHSRALTQLVVAVRNSCLIRVAKGPVMHDFTPRLSSAT